MLWLSGINLLMFKFLREVKDQQMNTSIQHRCF